MVSEPKDYWSNSRVVIYWGSRRDMRKFYHPIQELFIDIMLNIGFICMTIIMILMCFR